MKSIKLFTVCALIICLVSAERRSIFDEDDVEDDLLSCPIECDCKGYTVDCSNRGLKFVPKNIPSDARRVDLGGNNIILVRREDFLGLNGVKILDLRMNEIVDVEDGAFQALAHLDELILFQNRLKEIRPGMFKGLRSLKTLLLNANNITNIKKDTFNGLHNLNLLSLYDNAIETILEGTFNPLDKIQVLHLGKNPFRCDCHLKWMAEYLNKHPVETSGAKCEGPKKFAKRKLTQLDSNKFKCKDTSTVEEATATQAQAMSSVMLFTNTSSHTGHPVTSSSSISSSSSSSSSSLSSSFPCPENCTCYGDVIKCGSLEMVTSSTPTLPDEEDLYLDDPSDASSSSSSNSYAASDLHKLSKHLNANSNKISLLLCQKGRCIPIDDLNYECKCKNGYSGPFCEQAPTCQKEVYREYYTEDGCRSKKKLKLAECVGSCGDQCCTAVKTRERPVKMVCANGKMYTKNVEIVEKCACDRSCA